MNGEVQTIVIDPNPRPKRTQIIQVHFLLFERNRFSFFLFQLKNQLLTAHRRPNKRGMEEHQQFLSKISLLILSLRDINLPL